MKELKLYKFIMENSIEIDWRGEELVIWLHFLDIKDFVELVGADYLSDGGHDANIQEHYIALDLVPICEYFDIEPTEIHPKED